MSKIVKRLDFGSIKTRGEMPHFLAYQRNSYENFLQLHRKPEAREEKGLEQVFQEIFPIEAANEMVRIEYIHYELHDNEHPLDDELECKKRGKTYSASLKVKLRLINKKTEEIQETLVYFGEIPLMTDFATFIINGAERVVVAQLHRSPGVSFNREVNKKTGKELYTGKVIPYKGTWLEFITDKYDFLKVKVDRKKKILLPTFLKAIGFFESNTEIMETFLETKAFSLKDHFHKYKDKEDLISELKTKIEGSFIKEDVINEETGEILIDSETEITEDVIVTLIDLEIEEIVYWEVNPEDIILANALLEDDTANPEEAVVKVFKKLRPGDLVTVDSAKSLIDQMFFNEYRYNLLDVGRYKLNKRLKLNIPESTRVLTKQDLIEIVKYMKVLYSGEGYTDDIDKLSNRRVRGVGELLRMQFKSGMAKMEKMAKEKMTTQDIGSLTAQSLLNTRPLNAMVLDFFGSGQLSQFMDQSNPLAELTHKRRISALGPGGLSRERAGFEVRDVHNSHYGRICPIETPEGPNIGLIGSLATFGKVNRYGFIETPYLKLDKGKVDFKNIEYLSADDEEGKFIAQADTLIDDNNVIDSEEVVCRYDDEIVHIPKEKAEYLDVSPKQVVSVSAALIPFLEHDDANRALMGSNMQRQSVPLLKTEAPFVGTGVERKVAVDSGAVITSKIEGTVTEVDASHIVVENNDGEKEIHKLMNFERSNQAMCLHQKPIVDLGEKVNKGSILADGHSTQGGDLALGRNVMIAFMPWEGYNFEDSILVSERLVKDDIFTSIHIEEHEIEARTTKLGDEEITREIPNVGESALKNLDENGVIRVGAQVSTGDILVGKTTPKGETEPPAEEKLLRAIFGEKARDVRDTSLKLKHGAKGTVIDVLELSAEDGDELKAGVIKKIRVYIAEKRKLTVGDKMSGRHGNKGVISKILPVEDMPYMDNGDHVDIVLNPLGVPSRMNIGQVLETHLGLAAGKLNTPIATPVFDGISEDQIKDYLEKAGYPRNGKIDLYDGRTGDKFDNPVTVGYMYVLKLHHLAEDKMHARAIGPYSLVTQQPLGGKAQFGGQRLGEMEVWALEAYGASNILQEMLTVKSDDVTGRTKTYEAIVKGEPMPEPDLPESFRVLIKEFQSLALDVELFDKDGNTIDLDGENKEDEGITEFSLADLNSLVDSDKE
ncbi:MAG: DNA-directed RNA polymerase subunit beta [Fusobacteriota bacterium]